MAPSAPNAMPRRATRRDQNSVTGDEARRFVSSVRRCQTSLRWPTTPLTPPTPHTRRSTPRAAASPSPGSGSARSSPWRAWPRRRGRRKRPSASPRPRAEQPARGFTPERGSTARELNVVAAEKARRREPLRIGIVDEERAPVLDPLDHAPGRRPRERGAAPAPAEPAERRRDPRVDVVGAVHDDPSFHGAIVDARLEPRQPERRAVAAHVGLLGAKEAEARLPRALFVGERGREVASAVLAVRDQLVEEHPAVRDVDDPEPSPGGGQRVVDHGEKRGLERAGPPSALVGAKCHIEDLATG